MADEGVIFDGITFSQSLSSCLLLAISFFLVFYIKKSPYHRDHPETIKLRSFRALAVCIFAPIFVYLWSTKSPHGVPIWRWLGVHTNSLVTATLLPLILTMTLFSGPLMMMFLRNELPFMSGKLLPTMDLITIRNLVIAPLTEEIVYRACMIPLLVPPLGLTWAVLTCPLLFGVAHFHHAIERLQAHENALNVCLGTIFQFSYTTVFGVYSAFLFIRTGHVVGPFICHSYCNYMGIPEFFQIPYTKYPNAVRFIFVAGLISFILLLKPLTDPTLYNSIYFR